MRASKATRLHRSSPDGAVTSETFSPPGVWSDEVCTSARGDIGFAWVSVGQGWGSRAGRAHSGSR
jgi:hypothetical protein